MKKEMIIYNEVRLIKYGDYAEFLVGIHEDKEEFLKDVKKRYNVDVKKLKVQNGKVYGEFGKENSRFMGGYTGANSVDVELFEKYGTYCECFYIEMENIGMI